MFIKFATLWIKKKKTPNKQQNEKPTPNNYKYKDSHTPDTCSLRDS